ncbi:hypothetical protein [Streptomyces barringtoniae]|uniref:hypothetical protein n=1 Tax=Streptomyces barringtoniae TaxID=2892029 RepID=UPI001E55D856|nr:hypothetical protein [Streptomyces barringtoniae]MCC5478434.1 hypothetical protein [Streptomyces barringtoniae]
MVSPTPLAENHRLLTTHRHGRCSPCADSGVPAGPTVNEANGRPYDRKAYNSAKKKLEQAENYAGSRNRRKNRSQSDSLRVALKALGLFAFIIALVVTLVIFWEVDIVAAVLWALS